MLRAAGTPPPRCSCAVASPARPPLFSGLSGRFPRALRGPLRAPLPFHDPLCFFLKRSPLAAHSLAERLRAAGQLDEFQAAASEMVSPTPRPGAAGLSALRRARRAGAGPESGASEGRGEGRGSRTAHGARAPPAAPRPLPARSRATRTYHLWRSPTAAAPRGGAGGTQPLLSRPVPAKLRPPRPESAGAPRHRSRALVSPVLSRVLPGSFPPWARFGLAQSCGRILFIPYSERPFTLNSPRKHRCPPAPCGGAATQTAYGARPGQRRYANRYANRLGRP
ncbi:verprolin-like [Corvus hawaiiensis]|uniref:verprolin-like n=1 Tax=Corvus hawaiiensis TaxID=134902 RepID=UPI0020188EFB|nr:verprolin-like [Corvus hawaiiensis]